MTAPPDASPAAWVSSHIGEFGTVGGLVPMGFDRYMLVRPTPSGEPEADDDAAFISALASLAMRHTTTPEQVWFAIWEGYGWTSATTLYSRSGRGPLAWLAQVRLRRRRRMFDQERADRVSRGLAEVPTFELPNRRYYLLRSSLAAASQIESPDGFGLQVPDLWWPEDRSLFVATDTDLDWTYVGGSEAFASDLSAAFPHRSEPVQWNAPNSFS